MARPVESDQHLEEHLELAFAPLHKRHLGIALGVTVALLLFATTAVHLLRSPDESYPLILLGQLLPGYEVTWTGALVGAFWGLWAGFVAGWFFAFTRNLVLAISRFVLRAKAELAATRSFMDHI